VAAEPGIDGVVAGSGLRRELWPQLLHRDGRTGADGRVPLFADLPARRGAEREGKGEGEVTKSAQARNSAKSQAACLPAQRSACSVRRTSFHAYHCRLRLSV